MNLRTRLLLSTFILSATTTFVLSLGLRTAWLQAEQQRFEAEFERATEELSRELRSAAAERSALIAPFCAHDPLIDSALIGLVRGDLSERLLSLRLRLPELQKALGFDELALVSDRGELLAGQLREERPSALVEKLRAGAGAPSFRVDAPQAFVVHCEKAQYGRKVFLLGAEHLSRRLESAGSRFALQLTSAGQEGAPPRDPATLQQVLRLPELGGLHLVAARSRLPLVDAVRILDQTVFLWAAGALAFAVLVAIWLARGLAQPVVLFAERARRAVSGEPEPLPEKGGPELRMAAQAFNQTLRDLSALRERLALTERMVARREVARQIAHEIKNPLSPIRAAVETLRRLKARQDPQFESYFEEASRTVLSEVARIQAMVQSFSQYASLPEPRPTTFDLRQLTEELAQLYTSPDFRVDFDLPEPLPVFADRDQISQILNNLLKNAQEATASTQDARVRISARLFEAAASASGQPPRSFVLSLEDNGPGVPEEQQRRIFEPHFTTKQTGSGLGLSISQRIAVEHGGELRVEPASPQGACFQLRLPLASAQFSS